MGTRPIRELHVRVEHLEATPKVRKRRLKFPLGRQHHAEGHARPDETAPPYSLFGAPTSLRDKLIKIGAKVISHGRYVTFQLAEVAVSRQMFKDILMLSARLRGPPAPA